MTKQKIGRAKIAKKMTNAIKYLDGTPIDRKPLVAAVAILKLARMGACRGWLCPEEIAKLAKLVKADKPIRKHATVGKGVL